MMNLKPLGDRVIVKQDEAEETTAGGLILAHDAKEKPQTGVVLKVGEGKLDKDGNLVPVPVKEGDRVLYGKYGGTEVKVNGEEGMILRSEDIYSVFESLSRRLSAVVPKSHRVVFLPGHKAIRHERTTIPLSGSTPKPVLYVAEFFQGKEA